MHRIAGPGNVNGTFSKGNPALGQNATEVTPAWLNEVQEELMALGGGVVTTAADYSATEQDRIVLSNTTVAARAVHLPDPATVVVGKMFVVKNIGSAGNDTTMDVVGGKLLDGAVSQPLGDGAKVTWVSDGTNYHSI